MNILILHNKMVNGGAEKHIYELSEDLKNKGYNVIVGAREGEYSNKLKKIGIKFYDLQLDNNNIKSLLKSYFAIRNIIKKENIDIIHCHHRTPMFISHFILKGSEVKSVYTAHNVFAGKKYLTRFADKNIAVSKKVKDSLVEYFNVPKEKICVIYNGINLKNTNLQRKVNHGFTMVCVGRLSEQKGHIYLLDAMKNINNILEDCRLLIVGDGELSNYLQDYTKKNQIKNVEFLGHREDIDKILSDSDLFVLTSLWEGLPYVLIESLAQGVPAIASDVGGVKEIIIDNYTGFIVNPKNSEEVVEKVVYLYNNRDMLHEFGDNGINIVKEKFTRDKMVNSVIEVYHSLISTRIGK